MGVKLERDFRHSLEFILRNKPYTETDLLRKDFRIYLQILAEAEVEFAEKLAKLKQYEKV